MIKTVAIIGLPLCGYAGTEVTDLKEKSRLSCLAPESRQNLLFLIPDYTGFKKIFFFTVDMKTTSAQTSRGFRGGSRQQMKIRQRFITKRSLLFRDNMLFHWRWRTTNLKYLTHIFSLQQPHLKETAYLRKTIIWGSRAAHSKWWNHPICIKVLFYIYLVSHASLPTRKLWSHFFFCFAND